MHSFLMLREKLSPLRFDPALDVPACRQDFLNEYLHFYSIEFPENICRLHCTGTLEAVNYTIVAQYWVPAIAVPKGTIFILHGYYDHVGLLKHALQFLLEAGYVAVAYDQPGHGLSSGEQASIRDFSEYADVLQSCLKRCEKNFPKPWYGMGQSTGGAVLLHALMVEKMAHPFAAVILLAPLIKPVGWNTGVWSYRLLKHVIKKIPRHFSSNSNDETFVQFCRDKDPLQSKHLSVQWVGAMKEWLDAFHTLPPINIRGLLIQGEADQTVDWRYNLAIIKERVKGLEYELVPQARHHLLNERSDLREQVFTRIHQFLLASPQS